MRKTKSWSSRPALEPVQFCSDFEQPLHQPARKHAGDTTAIVAGREGSLHRHDLIAHEGVETGQHAFIQWATAQCGGTGKTHGPRIGTSERDLQIDQSFALSQQRDGDACDWIFDRAANADLIVG